MANLQINYFRERQIINKASYVVYEVKEKENKPTFSDITNKMSKTQPIKIYSDRSSECNPLIG